MTLDRQYGQFVVECEEGGPRCDKTLETSEHDFNEALAYMHREGWYAVPVRAPNKPIRWIHVCPNCQTPR